MKKTLALITLALNYSLNSCGQAVDKQDAILSVRDNLFSFTCPDGWSLFLPRDSIVTLIDFKRKDNVHSPAMISVSSLTRNDVNNLNELRQVLENNRKWTGAKLLDYYIHQESKTSYLTTTFLISNSKVNNVVQDLSFLCKGKVCIISLVVDKSQQEQYAAVPAEIFKSVSLH